MQEGSDLVGLLEEDEDYDDEFEEQDNDMLDENPVRESPKAESSATESSTSSSGDLVAPREEKTIGKQELGLDESAEQKAELEEDKEEAKALAKDKARDALQAALYDENEEEEAKELAKDKARDALQAALSDENEEVEAKALAKDKARDALQAALLDEDEEEEAKVVAKDKARDALQAALYDETEEEEAKELAKDKARDALQAALYDETEEQEAKELAKDKARDALQAALFDEDEEEEAKERQDAKMQEGSDLLGLQEEDEEYDDEFVEEEEPLGKQMDAGEFELQASMEQAKELDEKKVTQTQESDLVENFSLKPPQVDGELHVSDIETSPSKASDLQPLSESLEAVSPAKQTPTAVIPPASIEEEVDKDDLLAESFMRSTPEQPEQRRPSEEDALWRVCGEAGEVTVGDQVKVLNSMKSDSKVRVNLPKGTLGRVVEVNKASDVCIRFDGFEKDEWIYVENFDNLKKKVRLSEKQRRDSAVGETKAVASVVLIEDAAFETNILRVSDVSGLLAKMLVTISGGENSETHGIISVTPDASSRFSFRQRGVVSGSVTVDGQLQYFHAKGYAVTETKATQRFAVGDRMVVLNDMRSDSVERVDLPKGTAGYVIEVDEVFDVCFWFDGFEKGEWIFAENCGNLSKEGLSLKRTRSGAVGETKATQIFAVGDRVVALDDMRSDSVERVDLPKGTVGYVLEVDVDSDIYIRFEGFEESEWIFAENCGNLSKDGGEPEESAEAKEVAELQPLMGSSDQEPTKTERTGRCSRCRACCDGGWRGLCYRCYEKCRPAPGGPCYRCYEKIGRCLQVCSLGRCKARLNICAEGIESRYEEWDAAYKRCVVEDALWRVACNEAGEVCQLLDVTKCAGFCYRIRRFCRPRRGDAAAAALEGRALGGLKLQERRFSPSEVLLAFRGLQRYPSVVSQAADRKVPWGYAFEYCLKRGCVVLFAFLLFFFLFALIVYSPSTVAIDENTSMYVDPDARDKPVGTAATIDMKSLWEIPSLPMSNLRAIDDVFFFHERAAHILHIASLTKDGDGEVTLLGTDGSSVRVVPDGRAFWRRRAEPEAFLNEMEAMRSHPDMGRLRFAALSKEVTQD